MRSSQIPVKFPLPFANNASASLINQIPQASQIGIVGGAASLFDGFPPVCFLPVGAGGIPPWGRDFNGLFNQITAWVQFADNAGCAPPFDSTFSTQIGGYPQGSILYSATGTVGNTDLWLSTIDNNVINPDLSYGGTGAWVALADVVHIQNEGYISADDTGAVSNTIVFAPQPPPVAYQKYQRYQIKIANQTTGSAIGSVTANMFGVGPGGVGVQLLGAQNVVYADLSPPSPLMFNVGEVAMLVYDGTQFQVENRHPTPVIPIGNPTIYVRTDGNDSNSGLVNTPAGAMRTIQAALTRAQNVWALQGKVLTVQMGIPGTYASFQVNSFVSNITVQGSTATGSASTYIIAGSASSSQAMVNVAGSNVTLRGLTITSTTNTNVVSAAFGGALNLDTVFLNQNTTSVFSIMLAAPGGSVTIFGPVTVSGNAASLINSSQGVFNNAVATIAISGSPTYSSATVVAAYTGTVNFSNVGAVSGSPTATRYDAFLNAVINTNGGGANFFPGNVAGTTASGGQYA